ncbi:MAG: hypothetical protein KY453_06495 [Gemmatimonadetes bacterium]|nr:hypothetical protein [Gemmatimonadota bacterium]
MARHPFASHRLTSLPMLATLALAAPAAGQSVTERPPNMTGSWSGQSGTVYFNFLHRFTDTGAPLRKVINYPTFLLAAGLPAGLLVGARYGTNSELVSGIPNEWELFGRYAPLEQTAGAPLDLSLQVAYNDAAESGDGEVTVARTFGERLRLMASGRWFSNAFDEGEDRFAWAGGGVLQISPSVALAGDYARLTDLDEAEGEAAWSAGIQLRVPFTPHSLSLQASNATTTTLQGASLGVPGTRWGFEFTVPITLSRYFGGDGGGTAAPSGEAAAEVSMTNQLSFTPSTVRIAVGETVRWTNGSDIVHTVTADPDRAADPGNVELPQGASSFHSGEVRPGQVFEHTFTVAGTYRYVCLPHEGAGMMGTVVVEEGGR